MPLTPYQSKLLIRLEKAFLLPVEVLVNPDSQLVTPAFESTFRTRLLYHHTVTDEVFNKKSFEYALRDALRESGISAEVNIDPTSRGYDVYTSDTKFSLKTEAAQGTKDSRVNVSKLMECAWLRTVASRESLVMEIKRYVLPHFEKYDRILNLQIFRSSDASSIRYVLIEIPKALFEEIGNLKPEDFKELGFKNGTSARVSYAGQLAYTLRFDGSDEKITISGLQVALCTIHGAWNIPVVFSLKD